MMAEGRGIPPTDAHQRIRDEVLALLRKEAGHLPAIELLAVLSQTLGQMIAFQDQRLGNDAIMETVSRNIELGNRAAIETFLGKTKGSA